MEKTTSSEILASFKRNGAKYLRSVWKADDVLSVQGRFDGYKFDVLVEESGAFALSVDGRLVATGRLGDNLDTTTKGILARVSKGYVRIFDDEPY